MPFTVHVENFQSLSDVTVVVDGFTVVTGTNNTGKSALMRAIRGAFQNARGTSYIRHGQTKSVVEITFGDGRKLRWEKGNRPSDKPTYIIDGGNPIHPGQAVPDEVRALGVKPITVGGREVWPQFAPQFTGQIFLLDQPGSILAEAVSDVNHVAQLNEALRFAESDKRSASAELKIRLADQVVLETAVKKYDGLDDLEAEIADLEAAQAKVVKIGNVIQAATLLKDRLDAAQAAVDKLTGVIGIDIPDTKNASDALDALEDLNAIQDRMTTVKAAVDKLAGVDGIEIPDAKALGDALDELEALTRLQGRMTSAQAAVVKLTGIPDLDDLGSDDATDLWDKLQSAMEIHDKLVAAQTGVSSLEGQAMQADDTFVNVNQEIEVALGDLGECPTCGTIHTGGHP